MATIRYTSNIPTDNISDSDNLDIIIYNGTAGNETQFVVIDASDPRKTIDTGLGKLIITGIVVPDNPNDTTYHFSAKARDEAGNLSPDFSNIDIHVVPGTSTPTLVAPTNVVLTEDVNGDVNVAYVDAPSPATHTEIWAQVILGSGGTDVRTLLATVPVGASQPYIIPGQEGKEFIVDCQSSDGTNSTTGQDFSAGGNAASITTIVIVPDKFGIYFTAANLEYLSATAETWIGEFSVKLKMQGYANPANTGGLFGTGSTADRFLLRLYNNTIVANISGGSLLQSSTITDLSTIVFGRTELHIYRDALGDVYVKTDVTATPILMFNKTNDFDWSTIFRASTSYADGWLYGIEITANGTTDIWGIDEGSGNTITSDNGKVLTINTNQGGTHIDDNMWGVLPTPTGYVEWENLSIGGRGTETLLSNLLANPSSYTPGTAQYRIAEIYDNYSAANASGTPNHNPEGFSHFFIPILTNVIANIATTAFSTYTEYNSELTSICQIVNGTYTGTGASTQPITGMTAVIGTCGTIGTAGNQATKNYDPTIGAMLSGDPLNPTPESSWAFNEVTGPGITAVIPLYITEAQSVSTATSSPFINHFQRFKNEQVAPFTSLLGPDEVHYTGPGYDIYVDETVDEFITYSGVIKVCVPGDSLGTTITANAEPVYNARKP